MKCTEVAQRLVEDLRSAEEKELRDHLNRCGPCCALWNELWRLEMLSAELRIQDPAPQFFTDEVLARLPARNSGGLGLIHRGATVFVALLLISALVAVFWLQESRDSGAAALAEERGPERIEWLRSPESMPVSRYDGGYVDVILEDSPGEKLILRLPPVIEVRQTELHDPVYLKYASH